MANSTEHAFFEQSDQGHWVYTSFGPGDGQFCGHLQFLLSNWGYLAHQSRRLIGELIVYPWSGVRRRRTLSVVNNAQTSSSQKPLGRSKPNFMWRLLG